MSDKAQTSAFAGLIADLGAVDTEVGTLAKALSESDKAGGEAERADGADGKGAEADTAEDDAAIAANADEAEGETVTKSFQITLEDGSVVEAVDGGELVKSLMARLERNETDTAAALGAALNTIKGLGDLTKSLVGRVDAMANSGVRRKAVLTMAEKPGTAAADLAKSTAAENTITSEELMAKALVAQTEGRVSGIDISIAEQQIQSGQNPSVGFIRAVLGAE